MTLQQLIASIRWIDILDILLNSFIVFRLYVLFRGTTAFRLLIGIAFLWVFHRIAMASGLIITSWAIQGTMAVAAMIIVFIFSDEIRGVLRSKQIINLLWGFPKRVDHAPVEDLVESVFRMAEKRCGALLVFPGTEDINDVAQGGIEWNGTVTREMIMSIFWKDNPVHDGAAIVEGAKVTRVGVILPLTQRKDLPSHYGTRHRAAVGLAEKRDALVVLVSEERGTVVAVKGRDIMQVEDRWSLKRMLQQHLGIRIHPKSPKTKEGARHVAAAVISLLFITGIWYGMTRGFINTLITLDVPVEYQNRNPEMEIVAMSTNQVRLQLSGSNMLINSLKPGQIRVSLDMANARNGSNTFPIDEKRIVLPPGIKLVKADPSVIQVTVDIPGEKTLPVQVDWVGKLAEGLILEQVSVTPSRVRLRGTRKTLNTLSTLYTEKISLDNIGQSGKMVVRLALSETDVQLVNPADTNVVVSYVVRQRTTDGAS